MADNTRTIVKKHERGPVRIIVTIFGILSIIGGVFWTAVGWASYNGVAVATGLIGIVFWVIMVLIARPKEEWITETVYSNTTPSPSSDSHNINNIGGFNN